MQRLDREDQRQEHGLASAADTMLKETPKVTRHVLIRTARAAQAAYGFEHAFDRGLPPFSSTLR